MTRRLRVARTERRTSAAARMRAHLLALEAWSRCDFHTELMRRVGAFYAARQPLADHYAARRQASEALAEGWAAAARRWA
jgi:hypothetical protein